MKSQFFLNQIVPILLSVVICAVLVFALWLEIHALNFFRPSDILLSVRWFDVLIGMSIYFKTSIDFAVFMGHLMSKNPGLKGRIAIELGTATGNALGTMLILLVWNLFREVKWLLALMILVAALVLFKLAEDSLEHAVIEEKGQYGFLARLTRTLERSLSRINKMVAPVLRYIIPNVSMKGAGNLPFWSLFVFSFTVPFILGLDDFAGYVPLFNVVRVFGFAIGVMVAHMLLNILLFISPRHTEMVVKNPVLSLMGSIAFIGLGLWGLVEVAHLIGV
ncbi:MAG: hypothetical protein WC045_01755 [Patescibacteria group bacterium]